MDSLARPAEDSERIRALDGLRGFAVLFAFAQHALMAPGTWLSADIFFVLSGFLITGELIRARKDPNYWTAFFGRRAARILPPLAVTLVAAALLVPAVFAKAGWVYALSGAGLGNLLWGNPPPFLSNLWPVAIEIHFYLFWPLIVRKFTAKQLICLCAFVCCAEPLARSLAMSYFHSYLLVFYLTPFRLDSLAAGSLLSLLMAQPSAVRFATRWSGKGAAALTLALVTVIPLGFLRRNTPGALVNAIGYSWMAAIACCLVAFLILRRGSMLERLASRREIASLGILSYGFYLYHPVVIWVADSCLDLVHVHHWKIFALLTFSSSIACSWLSFRFLEWPIQYWVRSRTSVKDTRKGAEPLVSPVLVLE